VDQEIICWNKFLAFYPTSPPAPLHTAPLATSVMTDVAWHVSHVRRALPTVERGALLLENPKFVLSFCRAPLSSSEERGRG